MSRYEGMEELLQRVRTHMETTSIDPPAGLIDVPEVPSPTSYERLLEAVLLLLHTSEQLRDIFNAEYVTLTAEQHQDLTAILGKVERQLGCSRATLQQAQPSEPI